MKIVILDEQQLEDHGRYCKYENGKSVGMSEEEIGAWHESGYFDPQARDWKFLRGRYSGD